jgi:hypothetical protein
MKTQKLLLFCFLATQSLLAQNILQKAKQETQTGPARSKTQKKSDSNAKTATAGANIGINTPTPAYPLELVSDPGFGIVNTNTTNGVKLGNYLDASGAWFGTYTNHPLLFITNDAISPFMTLSTTGALGINTAPNIATKLHVNGGAILSQNEGALNEQLLIGTNVANDEAKVLIRNTAYPLALKIDGKGSTSGTAVLVDGNMKVSGSISKGSGTFMIDHPQDPLNKYLYHSFVESPDMMNVYNGNIVTDSEGNATVQLPAYFQSLNMDYRYQLTPICQFAQAIVFEKVTNNTFKIKTDKPNIEVSWQVTGVRNDAYARQNRVQVEVAKPEAEKGKYLHPTAFVGEQ